jgi:hypothetical protein
MTLGFTAVLALIILPKANFSVHLFQQRQPVIRRQECFDKFSMRIGVALPLPPSFFKYQHLLQKQHPHRVFREALSSKACNKGLIEAAKVTTHGFVVIRLNKLLDGCTGIVTHSVQRLKMLSELQFVF